MAEEIRNILSLSGGKDSTALALYMRDRVSDMEYVFCDTGEELRETYRYLDQVEAYLGKEIIRLNAKGPFEHWLKVYGGYLPSPQMRWCTKILKLKPFEAFIGEKPVISYVGLRADEDRIGYISHKKNITTIYPFKDDGIGLAGVMRILEKSGIGMPPYLEWGRSHSGCYFCFFQKKIEWVRLLEKYPEDFEKAQSYEKLSDDAGKTFTWIQGLPLSKLRMPEKIKQIKVEYQKQRERLKKNRKNKKLVEVLAEMEGENESIACLICQL
ncbi:MAG: phosphoadenosine phosphosulfate reductase family protein [candidate division Zixibacteria bacterium]|nr:phosphoadenosine phosphosulfate reductase family protein [candidate division Zixibacteria bacterium]